jgi:hypothetical protein
MTKLFVETPSYKKHKKIYTHELSGIRTRDHWKEMVLLLITPWNARPPESAKYLFYSYII